MKLVHWLAPIFLVGYVMDRVCVISLDQHMIFYDTLNTVTTRTVIVNFESSFFMRLFPNRAAINNYLTSF